MRTLLYLTIFLSVAFSLQCVDRNGKNVDWYVMWKLPTLSSSEDPSIQSGYGYMYWDSNGGALRPVRDNLLSNKDAAARTLMPLYSLHGSDDLVFGMYNDHPPVGKTSSKYGHTKGVVALTKSDKKGFWLIHSVPRYPLVSNDHYEYPDYARIYGQSFLCISVGYNDLNNIGGQLRVMRPSFYDIGLPAWAKSAFPTLAAAFNEDAELTDPTPRVINLRSLGGMNFKSMAKNAKWASEIYSQLIAPQIGDDVMSETWMRPELGSYCKPQYQHQAENILSLQFDNDTFYPYTKDHSKYCVGKRSDWVCVGGVNRMSSQSKRPGHAACFEHHEIARAIRNAITSIRSCNP